MTNETSGILMNRFIMILMKHRIHTSLAHQDQIQSLGWVSHLHVAMYE